MSTKHPTTAGQPAEPLSAAHRVADLLGIDRGSPITERPVAGHPNLVSVSTAELNHDRQSMTFTSFLVNNETGEIYPVDPTESVATAAQRLVEA